MHRLKAMLELRKLRMQLTKALNTATDSEHDCNNMKMKPPTVEQAVALRQIILSCNADHVAR